MYQSPGHLSAPLLKKRQSPEMNQLQKAWEIYLRSDPMNCIIEPKQSSGGLFLGNIDAAKNVDMLLKHDIRAVLTVAASASIRYAPNTILAHKQILAEDVESFDLAQFFPFMLKFLEENLKKTNVLVHCQAGISRSATTVIAYLMKTNKWDFQLALRHCKQQRMIVKPNPGFVRQLLKFEKEIAIPASPSSKQQLHEQKQYQFLCNDGMSQKGFLKHQSNSRSEVLTPFKANQQINTLTPQIQNQPYSILQKSASQKQQREEKINFFNAQPTISSSNQRNPSITIEKYAKQQFHSKNDIITLEVLDSFLENIPSRIQQLQLQLMKSSESKKQINPHQSTSPSLTAKHDSDSPKQLLRVEIIQQTPSSSVKLKTEEDFDSVSSPKNRINQPPSDQSLIQNQSNCRTPKLRRAESSSTTTSSSSSLSNKGQSYFLFNHQPISRSSTIISENSTKQSINQVIISKNNRISSAIQSSDSSKQRSNRSIETLNRSLVKDSKVQVKKIKAQPTSAKANLEDFFLKNKSIGKEIDMKSTYMGKSFFYDVPLPMAHTALISSKQNQIKSDQMMTKNFKLKNSIDLSGSPSANKHKQSQSQTSSYNPKYYTTKRAIFSEQIRF